MNDLAKRTADVIATEINSIKDTTKKIVLSNSIEIGRRLVEAKEMVDHGQWSQWLDENVDYSQSSANNLMKLYREYGAGQLSGPNSQTIENLTYSKAVLLLGVPSEEREEFLQKNNVEELSARQLKKLISEKKELEEKLLELETNLGTEQSRAKDLEGQLGDQLSVNDKTMIQIETLKKDLDKANNTEDQIELKRLVGELKEKDEELLKKQEKMSELEGQLKKKPIDVPAVIEKIPEEVQIELDQLREKVKKSDHAASTQEFIEFNVAFNTLVKHFETILQSLEKLSGSEESMKYKNAVSALIKRMEAEL
ncbi:DUF3102 domain-containing protein [Bacillus mesophilum]|uniref:DUF3102 domain-containing protein n=1 Tax=Bacillus mesophilum TaxID=1071718 RepID=A0A7V7USU5_9BACI|nr:DUF3102 domain-containing protein [Bacillus mesophilum]KAB2329468.1 DUF3102 domain-containing protein [Bacillus mesophilum]